MGSRMVWVPVVSGPLAPYVSGVLGVGGSGQGVSV